MNMLLAGLALWIILHFIPCLGRGLRASLIKRVGDKAYQGGFALGVLLSVVLMVLGWRSAEQIAVYEPILALKPIGMLLILIGFVFFGLSHAKTNLKRYVRHPQLTGMVAWAIGHLLTNGDNLSVVLFSALGAWALINMILINRRDGAWQKPEPVPLKAEIKPIVIGLIVFVVFFAAHPYLFGVSPISG